MSTNPTFISVIMTSYNYSNLICEAIQSVIDQSYPYWELIIVDDGSSDDSLGTISQFIKMDKRIFLYTHDNHQNKGIARTIELGLSKASHDIVAFLESDDIWHVDSLKNRITLLQENNANFVYNDCEAFSEVPSEPSIHLTYLHEIKQKIRSKNNQSNFFDLFWTSRGNIIPTFSCVLCKKTLFAGCSFQSPQAEWLDFWLWSQMSPEIRLAYTGQRLTRWRIHRGSFNYGHAISSTADQENFFRDQAIHALFRKAPVAGLRAFYLAKLKPQFRLKDLSSIAFRNAVRVKKTAILAKALMQAKPRAQLRSCLKTIVKEYSENTSSNQLALPQKLHPFTEALQILAHLKRKEANDDSRKYSILIVVHELSVTGAPWVACNLARALTEITGLKPAVLTLKDGPMREVLLSEGFTVMACPDYQSLGGDLFLEKLFTDHFDAIIVNSFAAAEFIYALHTFGTPLAWWIHEGYESFKHAGPRSVIQKCFDKTDQVWLGSPLSRPCALEYAPEDKLTQLLYGTQKHTPVPLMEGKSKDHILFGILGSIIPRKGQDIALSAFSLLPRHILDRVQLLLVGSPYVPDPYPEYTKLFYRRIQDLRYVKHLETQSNDSYLQILGSIDVLICPSSDDPMPVVVTDALMMGKACIVTRNVGQAHLLQDDEIITIEPNSPEALSHAISNIAVNTNILQCYSKNSKQAYNRLFSKEIFLTNTRKLLFDLIKYI